MCSVINLLTDLIKKGLFMTAYMFPGQGSQKPGMGEALFPLYPELVQKADQILGYSIAHLCLKDPNKQLNNTAFTQPALYVVNALFYLNKLEQHGGKKPDYLLGHSLGEYNALWAAGVFDFETGLRLVQKRGSLMSKAVGGGMAAILGLTSDKVASVLERNNLSGLSIANFNAFKQQVISGPIELINKASAFFTAAGAQLYLPLAVTGAFHTPLMQAAREEFTDFLAQITFLPPEIPVIANLNAQPYQNETIQSTLSLQIDHSVQWQQSISYLLAHQESEFVEMGTGVILTNMVNNIKRGG
jgi:malonyl CoA-acyl carrier protein transacylase